MLATALVALAFQPLRSRAVRLADRFAYGPRAVPYEALAEFSRRLGDSPDPKTLLPAVADTAAACRQRPPGDRAPARRRWPGPGRDVARRCRRAGSTAEVAVDIPVVDRDEVLGHIELEMAAGRSLRERDLTLLQRHRRPGGDRVPQREPDGRADRRASNSCGFGTLELAESRRRLITAGDAERRRLERAIARDVVPHLEPLPA